jgi:hypothetical protein
MMRAIRHYFLTRALREKLLLMAFLAIGVLWWLSAFGRHAGAFLREARTTTARLATQALWIRNQPAIEAAAKKTAERLDPAKTLNGNQLVTTVDQLAKEAGLRNGVGLTPTTQKSGQFAVHTAEYNITNAGWDQLRAFYDALQQRSPYISIERFILSSGANPAVLTLNLKIVSVEIAP